MIGDSLKGTYNISYDHRNLIVQLYYKRNVVENDRMYLRTFSEFYKYDDAGNRIKKVVMKYTGVASDPTVDDSGDAPPGWNYELIQHYVRDVTGNELAVYNDTTVVFWNVYGIDNAGRINYSDGSWNFYLKDHLGSVRCVIDGNGDIISAEDLDMWGYRMTDRSFQSDTTFYKYTGKERDVTTGYDYFGARYYVSQIGRWTTTDTLFENYQDYSPYTYSLDNSLRFIDPDGRDPRVKNFKGGGGGGLIRINIPNPRFSPGIKTKDKVAPRSIPRSETKTKKIETTHQQRKTNKNQKYDDAQKTAREQYPQKVDKYEKHHIEPKYLGGSKSGTTVTLEAPYHQLITNEFRRLHPYGLGPVNESRRLGIMKEVYSKYPLPPNIRF